MTEKFNIYSKYGSDRKKETNGVPFYVDKDSNTYILVARWSNRNVEHSKAQAELTLNAGSYDEQELEQKRIEVFVNHLVKGWHNIFDIDGNEIPYSKENALKLMADLPDLVDELVGFALKRENYPIDTVEESVKNL